MLWRRATAVGIGCRNFPSYIFHILHFLFFPYSFIFPPFLHFFLFFLSVISIFNSYLFLSIQFHIERPHNFIKFIIRTSNHLLSGWKQLWNFTSFASTFQFFHGQFIWIKTIKRRKLLIWFYVLMDPYLFTNTLSGTLSGIVSGLIEKTTWWTSVVKLNVSALV